MKTITVLSLGAGVQSSALYLMAAAGEFETIPVAAIFADTGDEPAAVYRQLDYLREQAGHIIPIRICSQGVLSEDVLSAVRKEAKRCSQPPFFVINRAGSEKHSTAVRGGMLWRNCTVDYKLAPLRRETRRLMEEHGAKHVEQWIGISLDECSRMKPSGVQYISNVYPRVDRRLKRTDCLAWLKANGHPEPPKSACVYCPYRHDSEWRRMQREQPEDFGRAVAFDEAIRQGKLPGVTGDAYVHRSMQPLSEVDFRNVEDLGQLTLWDSECEGMCGV